MSSLLVERERTGTANVPISAVWWRIRRTARRTEGRLVALLSLVVLLGIAVAAAGAADVRARAGVFTDVARHSGPLSVAAVEVYRSLSDADATAASAFLAGGAEPAVLRERYRIDLAAASAALNTAASGNPTGESAATVAELAVHLPVYAGLVETARVYNRQGQPLGAAYLRESSELVRSTLLPAAQRLYRLETQRLADSQRAATGVPWLAFALGLLLLAALAVTQIYLRRRTRRSLNAGLLLATALSLGGLVWLVAGSVSAAAAGTDSRTGGTAQVEALAEARIAGLQARSDEALTLIARGNGAAFDKHFEATAAELTREGGLLARARASTGQPETTAAIATATDIAARWLAVHAELRGLDQDGDYAGAVRLATGTDPASAESLALAFDEALRAATEQARSRFDAAVRDGRQALSGVDLGLAALIALAVVAAAAGMWPRIAEYR